jgi:hypothetical protein
MYVAPSDPDWMLLLSNGGSLALGSEEQVVRPDDVECHRRSVHPFLSCSRNRRNSGIAGRVLDALGLVRITNLEVSTTHVDA